MRRFGILCLALLLLGACSSDGDGTASKVTTLRPTSTDVTQPIEQMQMKASQTTDLLIAHKWDQIVGDFNAQMKAGLTAEGLRAAWEQVEDAFGGYVSRGTTTRVRPTMVELVFDTPLTFKNKPGKSRVTYDADGKIAGLFILDADAP